MSVNAPVKVAVVGPPGAGKTAIIAQVLQHLRRSGSTTDDADDDPFYAPSSTGELPESAVWTPAGRSFGDDGGGGPFGLFARVDEPCAADSENDESRARPMSAAVTIHAASREVTIASCPTVSAARSPAAVLLGDGNGRPMPTGGPFATANANRASVTSDRHMSSRRSVETFSRVNSSADVTALLRGVKLECHTRLFDIPGLHPTAGVKRAAARSEVVLVVVDVAAAADGVAQGDDDALCDGVMRTIREWAALALEAASRASRPRTAASSPSGTAKSSAASTSVRRRSTTTGVLSRIRAALSRTPLASGRSSRTASPAPEESSPWDGRGNPYSVATPASPYITSGSGGAAAAQPVFAVPTGAAAAAASSARRLSRGPSGSSITALDELADVTPRRHHGNAYDADLGAGEAHCGHDSEALAEVCSPGSPSSSTFAQQQQYPLAPPSILVALNRSDVADVTPNHLRTLQRNVATALEHAEWASAAPQCRVIITSARNAVTIAALTDAVFGLAGAALEITGLDRGGVNDTPVAPPSPPQQQQQQQRMGGDRSPRAESPVGISFECSPLTMTTNNSAGVLASGRSLPVHRGGSRRHATDSPVLPVTDTARGSFLPPPGTSLARGLGLFATGTSHTPQQQCDTGSFNRSNTTTAEAEKHNGDEPSAPCRTASSQHGPFHQNRASED